MSKLTIGAGASAGDFVKTLVNQETGEKGFQDGFHVHKSWFRKCWTFDQVMENMTRAEEEREDKLVPLSQVSPVLSGDKFVFEVGSEQYEPTVWALSQFSTRLNLPSSTVLRELLFRPDSDGEDASTAVKIAQNAMRRADKDKKFRLRTYNDGTLRAFLTEKYAPVNNLWYMETLNEILPGSVYSHWRGDNDTIYGNVLMPDSIIDYGQDDDSDYGGMVSIGNCEIGRRRIDQHPSVFRSICMNGCIWNQKDGYIMNRRHIGKIDLNQLRIDITNNIENQIALVPQSVRQFLGTRNLKVDGSMKATLAAVCLRNKVERTHAQEILNQFVTYEKDHRSLFGIINAITRAGQTFGNESWVQLDSLGGKLMMMKEHEWAHVQTYSNTLTGKEVEETFLAATVG